MMKNGLKKREQRQHRLALTLLLSGVVFLILLLTLLIVAMIIFAVQKLGLLRAFNITSDLFPFLYITLAISLVIGSGLALLGSKIPLAPVNRIINTMNRLASGDFSARLHFGTPFARHPTVVEFTDSFNTMAEELENTEILRSDFINDFSHEFKTPIVSITGFAKLLKKGDLSEKEKAEYLDIIEKESMRLSHMATAVLELTKVENQTILRGVTRFNLSEQLRTCTLMLEDKWTAKNVSPVLDFDEVYISGEEGLLKEVWINLIDNAVKFSPEGESFSVGITERTEGTEGEDTVSVTVTNGGDPIPPESLGRIFRKFYQADESHASEGNGIGLAIAKRITALHGGDISVVSGEDGTSFTVRLPR